MLTQLRKLVQIPTKIFNLIKRFRLHYLAFLGPGLIATAAGNDAGGIATYSVAGALFGYSILWIMVPLTVSFILVQEMSARLGAVTGKGFSDLVRENFSLRTTVAMMTLLLLGNAGIVVSEFAGIAASLELFGITKYISVPIAAIFIWWLIVKGNYHKIERVFLLMSGILLSYIVAAFLSKPDPTQILTGLLIPTVHQDISFLMYGIALVGTTIAPFMQIYAQASVVEKGITVNDLKLERLDTIVGTVFANIVAVFIIIATAATLHPLGIRIETAADAARALTPFAGDYARILFGVGLLGASLLAAGVVPLTTAFAISNAFGWESGVNRSLDEAPIFYAIFTILIVMAATIILTPAVSLIQILVGFQVVNGILLPIELVFMMKLANNSVLMGKYRNGKVFNLIIWATIIIVGSASLLLVGSVVFGYLERIWRLLSA
ncbi:MAG: divalent metal cation transporter [Patescibacteria group bacterium]